MCAVERRHGDFSGAKTLDEWIDVYERRAGDDVHFVLAPDEQVFFNPEYGFFTYVISHEKKRLVIPKMCGKGRFLRHVIFDMVRAIEHLGFRKIFCCSRRRPEVYLRVLGGRFDHEEETVNINTGKKEPLYFYVVSLDDTKEVEAVD
ncbi:MAG: hypothetical protein RR214_01940 [Synergistaceae bacterium]